MDCSLYVDGVDTKIYLTEECLQLSTTDTEKVTIAIGDIVAIKTTEESPADQTTSELSSFVIHYIDKRNNPVWTKESITLSPSEQKNDFQTIYQSLSRTFEIVSANRPRQLLVLLNPMCGSRQGQVLYDTVLIPIFELIGISAIVKVSERHGHLGEIIADFDCDTVDGIVIIGGDGSFVEVMDAMFRKTQQAAGVDYNDQNSNVESIVKPVTLIPAGTVSGKAIDITDCCDVMTSTLHLVRGEVKYMNTILSYSDNKLISPCGVLFATLKLAEIIDLADRQLRWMRTFRYLVLPFFVFLKSMHVVPVEITVYSREKQIIKEGDTEIEKVVEKSETVKHDVVSVFISPSDIIDISTKKYGHEQMTLLCYKSMGRIEFGREIAKFFRWEQNLFDNPKVMTYKGHSMRIRVLGTPDNPVEEDYRSKLACVDGEIRDCPKAEFFVRLNRRVVKAFSSLPRKQPI